LAEVARRHLDIHDKITDSMVKETYELGKELGHGASGEVLLCKHRQTQQQFACKVVRKNAKMNDAQSMSTEIEIMKRIRHRHVVSMYELYETPKCLWIILELVDAGDLFHHLANNADYTEQMAGTHMKQMLAGVHYLHSLGVVHRDLKLENVLLSGVGGKYEVKIADFGLSALIRLGENGYDPEESAKRKRFKGLQEMWGTKEYFAPEVIDQAYGPQADVWALGCILHEMMTGQQAYPNHGDGDEALYSRIKHGECRFDSPIWMKMSPEVRDLIAHMLKVDPTRRLSASEALLNTWVIGTSHGVHTKVPLTDAHENLSRKLREREKREKEKAARGNR